MSEKESNQNSAENGINREEISEVVRSVLEQMLPEKAENKAADLVGAAPERKEDAKLDRPTKGIAAARFVRVAALLSKNKHATPDQIISRIWDDDLGKVVSRAFSVSDFTSGGFMLPEDFAREIIDVLRAATVVRKAAPRVIPLPNGQLTMRRMTSDATASYVGESTSIPTSKPAGDQIVLTAKKLAALVPISNDLLNTTVGDAVDRMIREAMIRAIADREDRAFIRGDGTANTPKGFRYLAASGNVVAENNSLSREDNLYALLNKMAEANSLGNRMAWFMNPVVKNALERERSANAVPIFEEMRRDPPMLLGFPVYYTTNIPRNLGSGSDESEIYLVNMDEVLLGETEDIRVDADTSAAYSEGGTMYSSFQQDETLIRMITKHDFALMHDEAAAVLTGVKWS